MIEEAAVAAVAGDPAAREHGPGKLLKRVDKPPPPPGPAAQ